MLQIHIRVLLSQESGSWVAQCLEYDIAAQGPSLWEAQRRFERTLVAQAQADIRRQRPLFSGIAKAPQQYFAEFEKATKTGVTKIVLPGTQLQEDFRLAA